MRELMHTFQLDRLDPMEVIGQIFFYNNDSYRILEVKKAWGDAPVILSEIIMQNSTGEKMSYRLTSKQSFIDNTWTCQVFTLK